MTREPLGRWRIVAVHSFDWREWDDEFVVHVGATADTCLLSAVAGHTLLALRAAGTLTLPELVTQLFGTTDGRLSAAEMGSLQATLQQLQHLGLIEAEPL